MSKVFIINKRHLIMLVGAIVILGAGIIYWSQDQSRAASGEMGGVRTIHMVTGEFTGTSADGKEMEAYRWDPGTVFVEKGENINLSILGVSGHNHTFIIEGMDISGEVQHGKETVVSFTANKEGIYRIICPMHADAAHGGPMIGYIVVD